MTHTIYKVGVCIDFKGGHFGQNNVILVIYFSEGWWWVGSGVEIIANTDNSLLQISAVVQVQDNPLHEPLCRL